MTGHGNYPPPPRVSSATCRRRSWMPSGLALIGAIATVAMADVATAQDTPKPFQPSDIFRLQWASDAQISPDGRAVAYVLNKMDSVLDQRVSSIWLVDTDARTPPRQIIDGRASSPRWSPDGTRLAYLASDATGASQLHVRDIKSGAARQLSSLAAGAGEIVWSPDAGRVAFTSRVEEPVQPLVSLPSQPVGAQWPPRARYVTKAQFRDNDRGWLTDGFDQVFVVDLSNGAATQLTRSRFDHSQPAWDASSSNLYATGTGLPDNQTFPEDTEIFKISLADGRETAVTDRRGPDEGPAVSPDGRHIAYVGYDEIGRSNEVAKLYIANPDGSQPRLLNADLDRNVESVRWDTRGKSLLISYADHGEVRIARIDQDGQTHVLINGPVGPSDIGRPTPRGQSFSQSRDGTIAFVVSGPQSPGDLAVYARGALRRVVDLGRELRAQVALAAVEATEFTSADGVKIEGWITKPAGFDPKRKYPLVLDIHGGPWAAYGPYFSSAHQLWAADGYVVLHTNPRGSTSYGRIFSDMTNHDYPSKDADDLMAGVDAIIAKGYIDPSQLFVTGQSGGGTLTTWLIGKTNRFRGAAARSPVTDWTSFSLTTDRLYFHKMFFGDPKPWDDPHLYFSHSPISLVGRVTTPTLLIVGDADRRTPEGQAVEYFEALKIQKVDTALMIIPGAGHVTSRRPSQMLETYLGVRNWFDRYRSGSPVDAGSR